MVPREAGEAPPAAEGAQRRGRVLAGLGGAVILLFIIQGLVPALGAVTVAAALALPPRLRRAGRALALGSIAGAALTSAALFAAYHYPLHGLSPASTAIYLLSGLVLATLYQASGGLLAPVVAHAVFDILRVYFSG